MASAFEKWADGHLNVATWKAGKEAWDAALEERDKVWQSWRKQLLDAWANDYRATMTALLEGGPELKEQK